MSDEPGKLERLAERYEHNPILRGLVQLVPFASSADTLVTTAVSNMREKRTRAFFDELSKRETPITEEEIQNDDFLHAFFATTHAALNTRQEEKIRLLASLFNHYSTSDMDASADAYEEHLSILAEMSLREFQLLCLLYRFEQNTPIPPMPDENVDVIKDSEEYRINRRAAVFWKSFVEQAAQITGVSNGEVPAMITRLYRTGLCRNCSGIEMVDQVYLTPNFYSFIQAFGITPQKSI